MHACRKTGIRNQGSDWRASPPDFLIPDTRYLIPESRLALFLIVPDERKRASRLIIELAPTQQCVLVTMCDPELAWSNLRNRSRQLFPIRMVGDDERKLDVALARSGTHT